LAAEGDALREDLSAARTANDRLSRERLAAQADAKEVPPTKISGTIIDSSKF
jgi:hypothetical protein